MPKPPITDLCIQNRGIGFAICQNLVANDSEPMGFYAVSCSGAVSLSPSLKVANKDVEVRYDKLSRIDETSMMELTSRIKKEHGGYDVLINNAGVYHYAEDITPVQRKETIDVNYRGTLKIG